MKRSIGKMKKEYILAILLTGLMPLLFIALAVVTLGWSSFGFSISPFGLVIEWGLNGVS